MCKKSVLQNGKLISRACSCFPGESSYNLRKGECPQTYSNGARALAILGSGLAERDKRDKRGSSCPGLRWAGSLTCAWKRELESMIIRTHTIIFPPLLHFVFKRRCVVGEGFPCAQVCVQWERPGTASRHWLLHLQTHPSALMVPATSDLGKATAKGITTKRACWVISTFLSSAYHFVHSSFKAEKKRHIFQGLFLLLGFHLVFVNIKVFRVIFLPVLKF